MFCRNLGVIPPLKTIFPLQNLLPTIGVTHSANIILYINSKNTEMPEGLRRKQDQKNRRLEHHTGNIHSKYTDKSVYSKLYIIHDLS